MSRPGRLLETFGLNDLHGAIKDALRLRAVGFDAVKHLLLCRIEKRPPKLDLDVYPYLPRTNVEAASTASYMALMTSFTPSNSSLIRLSRLPLVGRGGVGGSGAKEESPHRFRQGLRVGCVLARTNLTSLRRSRPEWSPAASWHRGAAPRWR